MRWHDLFDDLGSQFERARELEALGELSERAILERGAIQLLDRLRPGTPDMVRVTLRGGFEVEGCVLARGGDWLALRHRHGPVIVPAWALVHVGGLRERGIERRGATEARLSFSQPLRRVSVARLEVDVIVGGERFGGRITAVGGDHIDLLRVSGSLSIALRAIDAVALEASKRRDTGVGVTL